MSPIRAVCFSLFLTLATSLAAADALDERIAQHIRTRIDTLHGELAQSLASVASSGVNEDLALFYAQRGYAPAWNDTSRFEQLVVELGNLADDGLDPDEYAYGHLRAYRAQTSLSDPATLACRDVLATHAYLKALTHLTLGKLDPLAIEPQWHLEPSANRPDRRLIVERAAYGVHDPATAFAAARPAYRHYRALRAAHTQWRARSGRIGWQAVPEGRSLHPDMLDARVPSLRSNLAMLGYPAHVPDGYDPPHALDTLVVAEHYDEGLAQAVKRFQGAHLLATDGVIGRDTLTALNVAPQDRIAQLRVNLERARWRAHDVEPDLVVVDVAGALITYYKDSQPVWAARTQVGRPARPTPLLKSQITRFTFNPTWTVPPTILREDKLPEIQRDITYLAKNRIRVLDHAGQELEPWSIDWHQPGPILLRQDAGPDNALGQVAIRFPNTYSVYLHDTPTQSNFARERRNFSSGCVRVERAMGLVERLLIDAGDADADRVAQLAASGRTREVRLSRPIPILIAYWTADVDTDGHANFRPDVYQRDARILRALSIVRSVDERLLRCD